MTPYIFIALGFIQVAIGVCLWLNGAVIEKHIETHTSYFVDGEGNRTGYVVDGSIFREHRLVRK